MHYTSCVHRLSLICNTAFVQKRNKSFVTWNLCLDFVSYWVLIMLEIINETYGTLWWEGWGAVWVLLLPFSKQVTDMDRRLFRKTVFKVNESCCDNLHVLYCTGVLISPWSDQEGNKLERQKILIFIYPIYNHNWRNISTIYIYI